ncbi:putative bifunctional diguanylate cyclase/phosphodiesterase [Nitrincola alkalilacustris]|uniref:putative bifunctional diguanylate cyclase/phosphodiesterase n=1 Tax=Nitrincola alkalilacustris TaxID=1571224 RepID=UPI00124EEF92|nr:EAL domain-containing protein [Nitrincola alkalilacustris]
MPDSKSPKLLIVEDEPALQLLLKAGLVKAGYEVATAGNGRLGVEQFAEQSPALILMDVSMPEMDGFEACRQIRELERHTNTPILMLTGSDDYDSIQAAFESGATDFITKPINLPLLQQRIRYALRDSAREQELLRIQNLQTSASRIAGLAFWQYEADEDRFVWSDDAASMLGWEEEMPASLLQALVMAHEDDRQRITLAFQEALTAGVRFDLEVRVGSCDQYRLLKIIGERELEAKRISGALQDVTRQRRLEGQAEYLAHHDGITGLPNRRLFLHSLEEQLQQELEQMAVGVMVVELNRFQQLIDICGLDGVEQLLRLITGQLRAIQDDATFCAYLGSGCFAFHRLLDRSDLSRIEISSEQWLKSLDRPWILDGREIFINFSAGIVISTLHCNDPHMMLSAATQTAHQVRVKGAISAQLAACGEDVMTGRLSLEADLRRAIENSEFNLVYQPQLHLASNTIRGVEALVRWNRPDHGPVSPVQFIPIMEEMGLIHELGRWILIEACRQQLDWDQAGMPLRMGINLSPAQFMQADLYDQVEQALKTTGVKPEMIKLEITESLAMHDPASSIKLLERFKALGVKLAIDDFGIGFSSLEYLLRFPLDTLKIDRAFVTDITKGRNDRAIVRALTSLCHEMELTTIAEGVEDQRQCDYLDAIGVNEIQGYLISRPLPPEELFMFAQGFRDK